jgi:hypothetical protein
MKELLEYLFRVCGIDADPAATAPEEALKLIKDALAPIAERIKDEAVAAAIVAGKLRPDEAGWARGIAEDNLIVFQKFIELRAPVPPAVTALIGRLAKPLVSDALQESINKQIGLKPDIFAKYNAPEAKDSVSIDATTTAIMKQVGVSLATFLRYNPAKAAGV